MALDHMIVRVRPGETRIACTDGDGVLKDFALYRDQSTGLVGDVFLARVKKVVPAMEAAFVDIGDERDGFLGLADARPQPHMGGLSARDRISDYMHEGQAVMVQVLAAAREGKGAKLTCRVNVTGAFLVLTPNDPGIRVSKRISDDAERSRLRTLLSGQLQHSEGCVIRSGAKGVGEKSIHAEVALLRACWTDLQGHANTHTPPALLSGGALPAVQFLTQNGHHNLAKIVIDDPATAHKVEAELDRLGVVPNGGVERHLGGGDVFEATGVADQVAALMDPVVPLSGGGSIIIEETTAITTIDVNAGNAGPAKGGRAADVALATNLAAMKEIARQMRLRNLAA
ncbi:MAG: ribonuclease E/G [Magnetovibrio sp.]|nr:ribonuclease E/G [Magnetovibrio sp.]